MEEKNSKRIDIISGDGSGLDISPAHDYIDIEKPKEEKEKRNIIIPEEKK